MKKRLLLKLDYHRFEGQSFELNKVLAKYGYFLRVFELKKKFRTISKKKDSEKQEMRKKISTCVMEKFKGFGIVRIEYGRKLSTKFKPIDIIYKPVKKWDDVIGCYISTDLATAYRAEYVINDKTRHSRAFQCYYCNAYYNKKPRHQQHLEKCLEIPGDMYNFADQNLVSFEDNISNKGDLPLVAYYMDFKTTAPADNCLNPEQKNMFVVLCTLIFAFHPKLNLKRIVVQRSFGYPLSKLATIDYLTIECIDNISAAIKKLRD